MKIVITGSLGNIGRPLATELIATGHTVTVISSKSEKQNEIEEMGAIAAIGSVQDAGFLATTFNSADSVFAMIPPNFGAPDQIAYYRSVGSAYATAIAASGVKRVVHLSSYGAHLEKGTGFIVGSHHTESILNELEDVAITCLRPGYFYTNLYSYVGMVKNAGFFGANYAGDDKLILVHPSDIAVAAAEELTLSTIGKNIRYIASDEHTASEVAQIIGAAIGKPDLKWLTLTNEQMASGLEKAGLPAHVVANLVELGEATHRGVLKEDYELHKPTVLGKIKLEAFAEEFAAAF